MDAAEGQTLRQFQKSLTPALQKKGWWGVKPLRDPVTGDIVEARLGSPRRLRVIYDANMRTARAAGQWGRIQRGKRSHPYLIYELGPSREHRVGERKLLVLPVLAVEATGNNKIPLTMASTNSPKAKPDISEQPRQLTQSEIASLRQDMKESSAWMRQELQGRREQREAPPRPA